MTGILKRLVFVIGFLPVALYGFSIWLATGQSWVAIMDSFAFWCDV